MNRISASEKQSESHQLRSLLDGLVEFESAEFANAEVSGLSLDSRQIESGNLFLACAGSRSAASSQPPEHGISYAQQAITHGARYIAWEPTDQLDVIPASLLQGNIDAIEYIRVDNLHQKLGLIAARFYHHPSKNLTMIGVTGTNGKTSTTHFIVQLLNQLNNDRFSNSANTSALIGTLGNGIYPALHESTHTTPDAVSLQRLLAEFLEQDVDTVVMEVSSHALSQYRVSNVQFDIAVFTNLSRDHLDYHGDMHNYGLDKLKLFQFPVPGKIILNADDKFSDVISQSLQNSEQVNGSQPVIMRVSTEDPLADLYAAQIKATAKGLQFELHYQQQKYLARVNLVGQFNVDNLLAAMGVVTAMGHDIRDVIPALEQLRTVPGRMEIMSNENSPSDQTQPLVVIDYAHTPDALEKALISLRAHCRCKLICVFGCGGERDKGKRPQMAKAADRFADFTIVTTDNPRTEKNELIIHEIISGFEDNNHYTVISDRTAAIEKAINTSEAGDVILIAGKGHETYQEINGSKQPYSDKEVVQSIFSNRGKSK